MSQQERVVQGSTLPKFASTGFIISGVLLIVFNVLSPRPADPTSMRSVLTTMANQKVLTQLSQLMLAVGIWGLMIGAAGVQRSIDKNGTSWARLGFYGVVVGTTLWSITFGLATATDIAAANWMTASGADKAAAYGIAAAVSMATSGAETMSILMLWLGLASLGAGMARSAEYPGWLGWAGVVLGAAMVAIVGVPKFFTGYTSSLLIIFGVLAFLTTLWALVVGVWMARKAW